MSARRFLWRWSLRTLRREWRQHLIVFALIATAVGLSIGSIIATFNLVEPPANRYGTGHVRATTFGDDAEAIAALEAQGHPFGVIRSVTIAIPGSSSVIQVRAQDPDAAVTAPLLALDRGRLPTGAGEIAVTDGVALNERTIGETVDLGGSRRTIVGIVENPTNLRDEFVLSPDVDDFGVDITRRSNLLLVDAAPLDVTFPAGAGGISVESRGDPTDPEVRTQLAIAASVVAAVAMVLVALLVGSAFAVAARRRSRQYGLLGAAGATPRHVRQAATASGLAIGILGAAAGTTVAVITNLAIVVRMESVVAHRIDLAIPWWTVVPTATLAVVTAAIASWWPARSLSKQPIVRTIASMRPEPSSTKGGTTLGLIGAGAGTLAMIVGVRGLGDGPIPVAVVSGIVVALFGLLLLAPALIRLIGRRSGPLSLPGRMAGRAIARQQGRSGAVVAALTIALGIPVGVVVVTASIDERNSAREANLGDHLAIAWLVGAEGPEQDIPLSLDANDAQRSLAEVQALVPAATVVPIEVAIDPDADIRQAVFDRIGTASAITPNFAVRPADPDCFESCEVNTLGDRDENGAEIELAFFDAWIATPQLLDALGVQAEQQAPDVQAISRFDDATLATHRGQSPELAANVQLDRSIPPYTGIAPLLIWPRMVADSGWEARSIGWLIVAPTPLANETTAALEGAAGSTLLIETAERPPPSTGIRVVAIMIGALISLAILLSTVSLMANESSDDLRILRSIGADPGTTRRLTAWTAAILTGAGAVIAVPTGYLALIVLVANQRIGFGFVLPWPSILAIVIVIPLLAAVVGWLAGGRHQHRLLTP